MQRLWDKSDARKFEEQQKGQWAGMKWEGEKWEIEVRERDVRGTWAAEAYCAGPESYMVWSYITKCGDVG